MNSIIIYVSSRNNYDMLSGEVLKNINMEGFEFINIDDKSSSEELQKGKRICQENNIVFLENESRGVQHATNTLVKFIKKNRPNCKWVICFQHDCYPITKNFFSRISKLIDDGKLDNFGTVGFNRIDMGKHTPGAYQDWLDNKEPLGNLGLAHLSILDETKRWIQPNRNSWLVNNKDWWKPLSIEISAWTAIGINVDLWEKWIEPTDEYHFHLWAPDVSMQFLYHNFHNLVLPKLYLMNKQELKENYGIEANSAHGSQKGNEYHFGHYQPSHEVWKERWGWDYEIPNTILDVRQSYEGTLIDEFINHDTYSGPLKTFDLGEY